MIAFAYYLLKMVICSGLLFLYYHIALRDKLFHQWNRFYLLASTVLSLVIPCLYFNITFNSNENVAQNIQLLQVVYGADEYVAEINSSGANLSLEQLSSIAYSCVSSVVLVLFILALLRIHSIIRSHSVMLIDDIRFVNTEERDSPFSFFNYVFWNKQIELDSQSGEHIFQHELVHVREKHSLDKVFLQLILIAFWCNPFFWLIRKELRMIHEFIADKKSVGQSDARAFAAMILQATYPNHYNHLTNQFFQSSIKRRLTMLTKNHNPKISYISRILALPLFAFIVFAFTIKAKPLENISTQKPEKEITVVIDAGHGEGAGARAENIYEDELVLQLAKTIYATNKNDRIKILLTRENENNIALTDRVEFTRKNNADLFISLHMNATPEKPSAELRTNGYEVTVSSKEPFYQKHSELLGAALVQELSKSYNNFPKIVKRKMGIWVLDKNVCPSVLIDCGYITDKNDREFITKKENQKLIAQKILHAIELYASSENSTGKTSSKYNTSDKPLADTPKPVSIRLNTENLEDTLDNNYLIIVDGVEKGRAKDYKITHIKPDQIASIEVFKGEASVKKFGEKGKQGVVVITTKSIESSPKELTNADNSITIRTKPQADSNQQQNAQIKITNYGPFTERNSEDALLIIDGVEKGKIKDLSKYISGDQIKSINVYKGDEAIKIYSDKGKNGVIVITTKSPNSEVEVKDVILEKIFEKAEVKPQFPGGIEAWKRYLARNLDASIPSKKGAPTGTYAVIVQFIVHDDGSLSDIKTLTQHGYGMEEEVIRIIKRGPKWVPAEQNGHKVTSYRRQPITFVIANN
jgi:N-acetylmuramoyl-L-alanine amidase